MACLVIPTDLKVAAVLAQTHRKDSLLDDALLFHHIVNRFKPVNVHGWALRAQPKNPICILAIEVLSLGLDATECVFEHINACARVFAEVKSILGNETLVAASFRIALVKATQIALCALAVDLLAVEKLESVAQLALVELVDVLAASTAFAKLFAGDRCHARPRIDN